MPSQPPSEGPREPEDFAPFLATEEPQFLVGGQAVNLWAVYYHSRTAGLAPFVSRDVDVLGDRNTLELLGRIAGSAPRFFPPKPPTNAIGVVTARDRNGHPLLIEVLRHVHGASNAELRETAYTFGVGQTRVRVPGPIALLQAKMANVADLAQAGRQDARHVVILSRLLPAYLEDLQKAAAEGRMQERSLLELLERLLAIVTTDRSRTILEKLQIEVPSFFSGLGNARLRRLQAFLEKRLPRAIAEKQKKQAVPATRR